MPIEPDDYDDRRNDRDDDRGRRDEPRRSRPRRDDDDEYDDGPRRRRRRDEDYDEDHPRSRKTNTLAVVSLITGFLCLGIIPIVLGIIALVQISNSRSQKGKGLAITGIILGLLMPFIGIALLLPATFKVREAANRTKSLNNLEQIALGLENYHSAMNQFPPAIAASDGIKPKPTLSWRVTILPYMEYQQLHAQFHLDEPWDSPHNRTLIDKMPPVYLLPGSPETNTTHYRVFVGGGAIFSPIPGEKPAGLMEISAGDGTGKTFLVVEAKEAVPWTKPDELEYSPNRPLPQLGTSGRYFLAAMADGSTRSIPVSTSEASIRAAITYNGGEKISLDD